MDNRYLRIPNELSDAESLQGVVKADRFAEGKDLHITAPVSVVKREPDATAAIDTQLLYGERFIAYGEKDEWLWGQAPRDHYVGWIRNRPNYSA